MSQQPDSTNEPATSSLTELLRAAHAGDRAAGERAYRVLYPELCKIARSLLRGHQRATLLDTQGLALESYLRLVEVEGSAFEDRRHFYAYAAKIMRRIVIDFARRKQAARHGGGLVRTTLATNAGSAEEDSGTVLDVERMLLALEALDPTMARVVEMRYFGGYDDAEIAEALGVTDRTVRRYWDKARMFMLANLQG